MNEIQRHFDADRSGSIEGTELSNALRQFGYNLSPPLLQLILAKYGESTEPHLLSNLSFDVLTAVSSSLGDIQQKASSVASSDFQQPPMGVTFDRFVRACVVVKTLSEAFQQVRHCCSMTHCIWF